MVPPELPSRFLRSHFRRSSVDISMGLESHWGLYNWREGPVRFLSISELFQDPNPT